MSGTGRVTADQILSVLEVYGEPVPSLLPWVARRAPAADLLMIAETAAAQMASAPLVRWPGVADAAAEVLAVRARGDITLTTRLPAVLPPVAGYFGPPQVEILLNAPVPREALCYAALSEPGARLIAPRRLQPADPEWQVILSSGRAGGALPPLANLRLLTQLAAATPDQPDDGPDLIYLLPYRRNGRSARAVRDVTISEIEEYIPTTVPWYAAALFTRVAPYLGTDGIQPVLDDLYLELGYRYASAAVRTEAGDDATPVHPRDGGGRPGTRAPHVWVQRDGRRISTLDLFGRNFVLLAGPEGAAWLATALAVADRLGVDLDAYVVGGTELADPQGRFLGAYGILPSGAVLVRPDGFVGWRAAEAADAPEQALRQALQTLLCRGDGKP